MDQQTRSRSGRRYDAQFKADAIALVRAGGFKIFDRRGWLVCATGGRI